MIFIFKRFLRIYAIEYIPNSMIKTTLARAEISLTEKLMNIVLVNPIRRHQHVKLTFTGARTPSGHQTFGMHHDISIVTSVSYEYRYVMEIRVTHNWLTQFVSCLREAGVSIVKLRFYLSFMGLSSLGDDVFIPSGMGWWETCVELYGFQFERGCCGSQVSPDGGIRFYQWVSDNNGKPYPVWFTHGFVVLCFVRATLSLVWDLCD